MPNNPGSRRVGAAKVPAGNKLQRGTAVTEKIDQAALAASSSGTGSGATPTSSPAPSGAASGDLSGSYPNPSVVGLQTKAISSSGPTRHGQALRWNALASWWEPGSPNWYFYDVTDYGATGDGTTDNYNMLKAAIQAVQGKSAGGIDRVMMRNYGNGYTGAPTCAIGGSPGSGAAGTPLVSNVGANGKIGTVKVTNRGSGYLTVGALCGLTAANPVITCADTTYLSVGMYVDGPGITPGTTILAITPNVDVTLSIAPGSSVPFAQVAFGVPRISFSGGGGAGATADVVVGDGTVLFFPPGVYRTTLDTSLTGLHNCKLIGYGATLLVDGGNANGLVIDEFCRDVEIIGLKIMHRPAKYGNGAARDAGCGARVAGDMITFRDCEIHNSPNFGILYTRDRTTGLASYGGRIINCYFSQTCGDSIHASNSCSGLDIINPTIRSPGDDAIGIVADYGPGNEPQNINIKGFDIQGGGFRGIAILGAINVNVGPGVIRDIMGYGIEIGLAGAANAQDITFHGIHLYNIGAGGPGALYATRHGIVIQNVIGFKGVGCFIDTATGYGYYCDVVTDCQIDLFMPMNCALGDFAFGGGAKTRLSHLYRNAGALTYRGTAGTVTAVAPA